MEVGVTFIECDEEKQKFLTQNCRDIAEVIGAEDMICIFKSKNCMAGYLHNVSPTSFLIISGTPIEELCCFNDEAFASAPLMIYDRLYTNSISNLEDSVLKLGYNIQMLSREELMKRFRVNNSYHLEINV